MKVAITMKISFSAAAVNKLKPMLDASQKKLKFLHETEGCGCVMSGIPTLLFVDALEHGEELGTADPLPFYYDPIHKVFYEDHMRVDYNVNNDTFSLKSDSQIYTTHLHVIK